MPQLNAYTDDSEKSGHYILANVGGSHPITIQLTDLGEQILQKAGYNAGDNVPTKIVWSMFDIGILYTSGTINDPPENVENPDETFQQLGVANKLTAQEQTHLLNYLDEYTGPNQEEVDKLRDKLDQSTVATHSETSVSKDVQDDLDRLSNLYERGDLTKSEFELLKSRILDKLPSTAASHELPNKTSDTNLNSEQLQFNLKQELRSLVPETKYDDTLGTLDLDFKSTDDSTNIFINYRADEHGFIYHCYFSEQGHEERMFELLNTEMWDLISDFGNEFSRFAMITKSGTEYGFQNELPDGSFEEELTSLLAMIQVVYQTNPPDLKKM